MDGARREAGREAGEGEGEGERGVVSSISSYYHRLHDLKSGMSALPPIWPEGQNRPKWDKSGTFSSVLVSFSSVS